MTYKWKQGSRFGLDAQVVGETLEELRQRHSGLTAEIVLEEARPPSSPLHPAFEWNDKKAAEEYRKEQARSLIRSVVVYDAVPQQPVPVRAFVVVREEEDKQIYTATSIALSDPTLRAQVLRRALSELEDWSERYHVLRELADVIDLSRRTIQAWRAIERARASDESNMLEPES